MTTPIDYAPHIPWHRRRKFRRAALVLFTLALLAAGGFYFGPPIYQRCVFLYRQHACMNYNAPAGTVIWDECQFLSPVPPPPAELEAFKSTLSPALAADLDGYSCYVLIHARTCAAGERLVFLRFRNYYLEGSNPGQLSFTYLHTIFTPATLTREPVKIQATDGWTWRAGTISLGPIPASPTFIMLPAEPDPADPAGILMHFTIDGVMYTQRLFLNPAGDKIEMPAP